MASGPNSIPFLNTKYYIIFSKNKISKQLVDLFNHSFMTVVFPSVLKTAKVVSVLKKDSKLDYITIAQSPCYQILKKYLNNFGIKTVYLSQEEEYHL